MSVSVNDLYLKYADEIGKKLEDDRYFKYLYKMVQAGNNVLSQQHQVLHKVVDERWLSIIEDTLGSLNEIVNNPRRAIIREEEIVPVELAKKITTESVRHLSMNTQYIASDDLTEGVRPKKILNATFEETWNLYENRVVYYLIQRLVAFVDKRTDIIFWGTGDENQDTLTMESHIDDAYEQIEYRLEMKIKNIQNYAENDDDNLDVFKRIDRVRRLVTGLKNSAFCDVMAGCDRVHSPLQRTNLMVKDPHYKKCYQLWQFLDAYNEQGYSIEVENEALEFDEEYIIQLYTNLIANYTIFKSITESDKRDIEAAESKRRQVLKPRFEKEIHEEIVTDYNIPEVEVRQVLIEEVTQAQLDAEKQLREEIAARKATEKALKEAESSAHHSLIRAEYAESARFEAEDAAKEAVEKAQAMAEEKAALSEEIEDLRLKLEEKDKLIAVMKEQMGAETKDYFRQISEQQKSYQDSLDEISIVHDADIRELKDEYEEMSRNLEYGFMEELYKKEKESAKEIEELQLRSEKQISETISNYEDRISEQDENFQDMLAQKEDLYQDSLASMKEAFAGSLNTQKEYFDAEMTSTREKYEKQLSDNEAASKAAYEKLQAEAKAEQQRLTSESKAALKAAEADYAKLKNETETAYSELEKASEARAIEARTEAERAMAQSEAGFEKEKNALQVSMTKEYEDLKSEDRKKMAEVDRKCKEAIAACKEEAAGCASSLTAEINSLKARNDMLKSQYDRMEGELKSVQDTRNSLEAQLMVERDLKKAMEQKVTAKTVSDFRRAVRLEKKAKKAEKKINK